MQKKSCIIYPAGKGGDWLYNELKNEFDIKAFIDDNKKEDVFNSCKVYKLNELSKDLKVDYYFIATAHSYTRIFNLYDKLIKNGIDENKIYIYNKQQTKSSDQYVKYSVFVSKSKTNKLPNKVYIDSGLVYGGAQKYCYDFAKIYKDEFIYVVFSKQLFDELVNLEDVTVLYYNFLDKKITKVKDLKDRIKSFVNNDITEYKQYKTIEEFFEDKKPLSPYGLNLDLYIVTSYEFIPKNKNTIFIMHDRLDNYDLFDETIYKAYSDKQCKIVTTSELTLNELRSRKKMQNIKMIEPYIEVDENSKPKELNKDKIFTVGWFSRFEPEKDWYEVFDALKGFKDIKVYFMGTGSDLKKAIELKEELGLDNYIFTGWLDEPLKFIKNNIDLFIFNTKSIHDSFGIVQIEVASLGIPIIAYDNEVTRYVLGEGVEYYKNKEELKKLVDLFKVNKVMYEKVSKYMLQRAKFFNKEKFYHGWYNIINNKKITKNFKNI